MIKSQQALVDILVVDAVLLLFTKGEWAAVYYIFSVSKPDIWLMLSETSDKHIEYVTLALLVCLLAKSMLVMHSSFLLILVKGT